MTQDHMARILAILKPGDVVIFEGRMRQGTEFRQARVCSLQADRDGTVTMGYSSTCRIDGMLSSGQGFCQAYLGNHNERGPYGFTVSIETTGQRDVYPTPWSPRPGDRAYDSMC